jgi:hypothetical protein
MGIQEVISELDWLIEQGYIANYAIGGAFGAFQYIEPKFTEDIDVFVVLSGPTASTLAPLGPLWAALIERGAKVQDLYLVIGGWPVQFLAPGSQLYEEAIATAREIKLGNQVVRFMAPEYLALLALDSGHAKHLVRVEEFLSRKIVSKSELLALVKRFDLTERWKNFETKFLGTND